MSHDEKRINELIIELIFTQPIFYDKSDDSYHKESRAERQNQLNYISQTIF